jgi:hypothetical protein
MLRVRLPKARTTVAFAGLLMLSVSAASAASIDCAKIGSSYDSLFADANTRVQSVLAEFKKLPGTATEQNKDAIRKKFCAVGGELVGFYKFVQALAKDCAAQGGNVAELTKVVNEQLGLAQKGVREACGQ